MQDNRAIRQKILKLRWNLQPSVKTKLDHQIYLKTLNYIISKKITRYIALYWPMENEVDTIALIDELIKKGYKVCISYISRNKMVFKPIRSVHFEHEYWKNMRQPTIQSTINGNDIETMVVPLIGFNNSNYRLGYGFNHYNDFLHTYNIHTIGLAYDFQRNDDFVTNRYDKMLKMVITN